MATTKLNKIYPRDRLSVPDYLHCYQVGDVKLPELLANLIETKLNTHSDHHMVITVNDRTWSVYSVKVYCGNEEIGTLGLSYQPLKITLTNRTITSVMKRNWYMASGNANTLSAKYDKFIRPASAGVKSSRLRNIARTAMQAEQKTQGENQHPVETFVKHLTNHIMDNFDKYKDIAVSEGFSYRSNVEGDLLDTIPSLHSDYALVNSIVPENKGNLDQYLAQGFYLYISDGMCIAADQSGKRVNAHHENKLPEKLATKVGMLKIANDTTFIRGVGYRQQQDFFYISGDYNEYT